MSVSERDRPVLMGLAAMIAVAVAVGLVVALVALVFFRASGIKAATSAAEATEEPVLVIPTPSKARKPARTKRAVPDQAEGAITLTADRREVFPLESVNLDGEYPAGIGSILQVQRFVGSSWTDFPVTISVDPDGSFDSFIQTGQEGDNIFRVYDGATGTASNEIEVTVR
jgi:hypothetical protein